MLSIGFGAMGCGTFAFLATLIPIGYYFTSMDGRERPYESLTFFLIFAVVGAIGWYAGVQLILSAGQPPGESNEPDGH
jgi:hypothetical protein